MRGESADGDGTVDVVAWLRGGPTTIGGVGLLRVTGRVDMILGIEMPGLLSESTHTARCLDGFVVLPVLGQFSSNTFFLLALHGARVAGRLGACGRFFGPKREGWDWGAFKVFLGGFQFLHVAGHGRQYVKDPYSNMLSTRKYLWP